MNVRWIQWCCLGIGLIAVAQATVLAPFAGACSLTVQDALLRLSAWQCMIDAWPFGTMDHYRNAGGVVLTAFLLAALVGYGLWRLTGRFWGQLVTFSPMRNMFGNSRKRRALRRFVAQLPRDLGSRYGFKEQYTIGQVRATLEQGDYGPRYIGYAYAMFLPADEAIEELKYPDLVTQLRHEIAQEFFDGDVNFTPAQARAIRVGNSGHTSISHFESSGGAGISGD